MVPAETQEAATDCLPNPQSKSDITQLDSCVMAALTNLQEENESIGHTSMTGPENLTASGCQERVQSPEDQVCDGEMPPLSDEHVSVRTTEITQPCVDLAVSAASTELLPLNVEETLIREGNNGTSHDADAIMEEEIPEEYAFTFPGPDSTLDIQGSARSDQGAQGTCSLPSSSEQLTLRAASSANHSEVVHDGGVEPPNISYVGSRFNALADTSLPNNPVGQNLQRHLFNDPYEYELEKLRREEESLKKNFEERTSELMAELEKKMAEARSKYDRESQELDAAYKAKAMEAEANMRFVKKSSLLANAFVSKCSDRSESSDLAAVRAAIIAQQLSQRQQAVQTNTHMNSTAPAQTSLPTVTAPTPNPSGLLSHCNTTQPRPISQQATLQSNTHVNLTAPPPRPSVTTVEAPIPNPSGPLSHFPHCTTTQPRAISQQRAVQSDIRMNSTAPPPPLVTAAEPPTLNPPGPLSHFPRRNTSQLRPMSQQAVVQSNTNANPTTLARTSVTSEALPLHSLRSNMPRPRPPPVISNLTPSTSTAAPSPPVHGVVRAPAPHLKPFGSYRAPITAAAVSATHPRRLVQEQQQQQRSSNGGLVYLSDDDE